MRAGERQPGSPAQGLSGVYGSGGFYSHRHVSFPFTEHLDAFVLSIFLTIFSFSIFGKLTYLQVVKLTFALKQAGIFVRDNIFPLSTRL